MPDAPPALATASPASPSRAPAALVPEACLDAVVLRYWHKGARQDFTGRQFWRLVAAHMAQLSGVARDDGVSLVLGHTSPDQIALFVALIAGGRLAALFPPNTPLQDEAAYFAQQRASFAKIDPVCIIITEERLAETIRRVDPGFGSRILLVAPGADAVLAEPGGDDAALAAMAAFRARLQSAAPMFVQHSSGTTGIKKAVAISGQALVAQFNAYWPGVRAACGAERLRIASWLPLYHDMGLITSVLLPLLGGDAVSITDAFEWIASPGLLFTMIAEDGCDVTWLPNFAFRHLIRLRPGMETRDLSGMRAWIDCSEPCRFADAAAFERDFADWGVAPGSVLGCYAMAETVFAATQCAPGEQRALAVPRALQPGTDVVAAGARVVFDESAGAEAVKLVLSSGRLVPGMEAAVLVEGVPAGETIYGEIALRGPCLFDGYRGMTREESSLQDNGYFRTGDLGCVLDGHVFVFGRLKEIIIVNGKNLFAGDIEDVLNGVAGVRKGRVVAFGMESAQTGSEELVVVAELDASAEVAAAALRMEVSRVVADQFLIKPRDVRIVEDRWLVKSTSGKISRDENRRKYVETFRTKAMKG